jgi:hypothetical protein
MYDLIGDIHGHADKLKKLLLKMGYREVEGSWQHPERKVIFVGDFIDRGPSIREVLHIVRKMIDNNQALAVMGNHEYNAIAYAYQTNNGSYLRSHNATHNKQHHATLEQFSQYTHEWDEWVQWFYSLPLFLEVNGIRIVHACWDEEHIQWLKTHHGVNLTESLLIDAHDKKSHAHVVIEETLKGKEMNIPEHCVWYDKDGHPRTSNRIKWWVDPSRNDHDKFLFNCPDILKAQSVPSDIKFNIYPVDAPPVFFGHYWLEDKWPIVQSDNVICLDYSVAKGGNLVAYRWNGEKSICKENFVVVVSD